MGNIWTKILDEIMPGSNHQTNSCNKTSDHPATPIPKARRFIIDLDPRSPNNECVRTPIVVECNVNQISKDSDSSENSLKYLETDFEEELKTKVLFPIDPRSPTLGISRTPIQLLSTPEHAKALKSVLHGNSHLKFDSPTSTSSTDTPIDSENTNTTPSPTVTPVKQIEKENITTPVEKNKTKSKIVKTFHNKFNINENKENPHEILIKKKRNDDNSFGVTSSPRTPLATMQPGALLRIKQVRDMKAAVGASDSISGWDRDASVII